MSVKRYELCLMDGGHGEFTGFAESPAGNYVLHTDYTELEQRLAVESDRLIYAEGRLEEVIAERNELNQRIAVFQEEEQTFIDLVNSLNNEIGQVTTERDQLRAELEAARAAFADEVIALITTEQQAMSRLYEKHTYGINKVCNRLKLFVGDLLIKPPQPNDPETVGDKHE